MKKKKGGGGGGANWMDTYGDMVTLLLCFFVLLYSMSTISEDKWKAIVQSFNPGAIIDPTEVTGGTDGPLADPSDGAGMGTSDELGPEELAEKQDDIESALQALYDMLQQYVESQDLSQSVEVTKGDGYVFISFSDAVFFAGDSYVLLETGRQILDVVAEALDGAVDYIDEVRIMGHTAQALEDRANNPTVDRFLASNRATVTTVYIQERCSLNPARLVSLGYGEWRSIAPNDSEEHRARNRRVEIMITGFDLLDQMGDSIQQYELTRSGEANLLTEAAPAEETP